MDKYREFIEIAAAELIVLDQEEQTTDNKPKSTILDYLSNKQAGYLFFATLLYFLAILFL